MKAYPISWKSGPNSDKELRPHHGRPVSVTQDSRYGSSERPSSNSIIRPRSQSL